MESIEVTLPTGLAVQNKWYRTAGLRPLCGPDEDAIREAVDVLLPAELITILLTRCLTNLGSKSPVDACHVRSLVVGDRDALLLHLRSLVYGDKIQSILTCPGVNCGEKMDLEIDIDDILVSPSKNEKETYEEEIRSNGNNYKVKFRLPTGADQEAVAKLARHNSGAASKLLLQRCIKEIKKKGTNVKFQNDLPVAFAESISKRMAELDPQAEILLNLTCPACQHNFLANLDIGDYFFKELISNSKHLYREVHVLALHYHWSERDILNMSRAKRQLYLKLLADALNQGET